MPRKFSFQLRPAGPVFTVQAYEKEKKRAIPKSEVLGGIANGKTGFAVYYDARLLPIAVDHTGAKNKIRWLADLTKLDREYYLPIFFSGLTELSHPYKMLVLDGIKQLLPNSENEILRSMPTIAFYIRGALKTHAAAIIVNACTAIKALAETTQQIALAIVRYHKGILIEVGKWKDRNINVGNGIGKRPVNVMDVVEETLKALELTGGAKAYVEMKLAIPTYTSCFHN